MSKPTRPGFDKLSHRLPPNSEKTMRRIAAVPALLVVLALALTGCGAGSGSDSGGATARVSVLGTDVRLVSSASSGSITQSTEAVAGDHVITDSAGLAELRYADDSLTRVGPGTDLTVLELSSSDAQRTAVSLEVGQTWHRVQKLVAEDARFEVETPVGVAAVHGTAFAVECTDAPACEITVLDGEVEFTLTDGTSVTIGANQRTTIPNPGGGDPVVEDVSAGEFSDWASANLARDNGASSSPTPTASTPGPTFVKAFDPCPAPREGDFPKTLVDAYEAGMPAFLPEPSCTEVLGATTDNPFTWAYLYGGTREDLDAIAAVAKANGYTGDRVEIAGEVYEGVSSESWELDSPAGERLSLSLIVTDTQTKGPLIIVDWGA
ncbi:FecR family protein [Naasia lichenicola]|uniref:FecR family protein n=1 Tax=Naasia lichenicola TaxID=2565933 RepID=UPI00130DBFAE|nr:FecR family protein [Naasia lichenicola]